jgi:hypothetical protein
LYGKHIHITINDTMFAAFDSHLGQSHECVEQQILKRSNVGLFPANALYGAPCAFSSLFTLVAKHMNILLYAKQ